MNKLKLINIHVGIHKHTNYVKYPHNPESIEDYDRIISKCQPNLRTEETVGSGRFTYGTVEETVANKRYTAKNLNIEFAVGATQSRYQADGTVYRIEDIFPIVLFDLFGYVYFGDADELYRFVSVSEKQGKNRRKSSNSKENKIKVAPIPVRNNYISGVCPVCQNDYTDLESHYLRYPSHRKWI